MTIQSLRHLGSVFLGPTLSFFNQQLHNDVASNQRLFFLAREGFWLEQSYQRYADAQSRTVDSQYLLVSRAFLFKVGLLNSATYDISLNFSFEGSLYELMRTRFMLSDVSIRNVFSDKQQQTEFTLPSQLNEVAELFTKKQAQLSPVIAPSFEAYKDYLTSLGFLAQSRSAIVDIGYSGTIQTLLTILFDQPTDGYYLMASKPGDKVVAGHRITMRGYLKEGKAIGDGYLPLDRSMFFEALLTAPCGQFQDIRKSQLPGTQYNYYYGRKVATQHLFHCVTAVCEGALERVAYNAANNVTLSATEVESLIVAYVSKKGLFPQSSWPLFSIDDDIASEGTVNGIDFFGLKP